MPSVKGRAVQVPSPKAAFELVEKEFPEPGPGQVRIRVQACGICHSDSVTKDALFPGIAYPRVPGHEVAGIVDAVGRRRSCLQTRPARRPRAGTAATATTASPAAAATSSFARTARSPASPTTAATLTT